jgi:hypothetical protein
MGKKSNQGMNERDRFIDAARELGCDESPEEFKAIIKQIAKASPMTNAAVKKKAKQKKPKRPVS